MFTRWSLLGQTMSLLQAIQTKKSHLNPTETVLTTPDGRRYLQNKSESIPINSALYGFVVDTKPDKIPARIIEHIYLGSQDCCEHDVLSRYNITSVLSVGVPPPCEYPDVDYKYVACLDLPDTDIKNILVKDCVPFIEKCVECNSNVLIHCNAGVSRSSAVVIGYLVLIKGYTYDDAYTAVKIARSCVRPNKGFEEQLKRLSSVT